MKKVNKITKKRDEEMEEGVNKGGERLKIKSKETWKRMLR